MTATVQLSPLPKQRFTDANGNPLSGGKVFTYAAGTTTKQNSYTDATGGTPNQNPVLLDARGEAAVWLDQTLPYKVVLAPANDTDPPSNPIWTVDNIPVNLAASLSLQGGSALVGFLQFGTGAIVRTVQAKLRDVASITDFGAVGDGVTDDTAAINAALAASKHVIVPAGMTSLISATIAVPVASRLDFLGGFGNTNGAYPASYFIKKSTMTTAGLTVADRAWVSGGGIIGQAGNTGDGIQIIGNSAKISHFTAHNAGGNGVRVGTDAGGNFNSFELQHVTSQYNGGKGFYIHDGKLNVGADANAGTLTQCFSQHNTGDGYTLGHCFWVTLLNCLSETNTGYGLYLSGTSDGTGVPQTRYATIIGGDYNEGNTAGQVFDQGYFTQWLQPDIADIPSNAGSGLAGSGVYQIISNRANKLVGATLSTGGGSYPVLVDDGSQGNATPTLTLKKKTTAGNNQGPGLAFSIDPNSGTPVNAAKVTGVQNTTGVYGLTFSGYKAGAETDAILINLNSMALMPAVDNTYSCGASSLRWSVVYAATSTINTSDGTTKQQVAELSDVERRVAVRIKGLMRTFRFNDAVAVKGDAARIHAGAVAQDVQAAFVAEGLDPARYALFCSDTWWEIDGKAVEADENGIHEVHTEEIDPGARILTETDFDPSERPDVVRDAIEHSRRAATITRIERVQAEKVTRLGLRYEEMFAFVIGAL